MELRFSTWQEVERYLQGSKSIVVPIGWPSTEISRCAPVLA